MRELELLRSHLLAEGQQKRLEQHEGLEELIEYVQSNWEGIVNHRTW